MCHQLRSAASFELGPASELTTQEYRPLHVRSAKLVARFLPERVRNRDAEILLARIEIFRQYAFAARAFGGRNDHAVIEVDAVGHAGLDGPENQFAS